HLIIFNFHKLPGLGCPSGDDYRRYEGFESIRYAVFVPICSKIRSLRREPAIMVNRVCIVNKKVLCPQDASNPAANQRVPRPSGSATEATFIMPIFPERKPNGLKHPDSSGEIPRLRSE